MLSIPQYYDYILNIVGDGPERENLEKLALSLGIEKNVIFHGYLFHTDAAPLGRRAKALLINTKSDLNMVSVPESIVNGTPVLMNEVPNTAHFVNSNGLGIAKKDWDEKDLMEMIARYEEFHLNCSNIRDSLTNESSAKKIVDISENL